jgi:hypothetical protein
MPDTRSNAREVTKVHDQDRRMRLVYMVIFAIIAYSLFWLILFLAAVQFVLTWINRRPNENLRDFSGKLNAYFHGVLDFLGYASETVPFPFSPLEAGYAAAATPARKPAPRKRSGGPRAKSARATAGKDEAPSD